MSMSVATRSTRETTSVMRRIGRQAPGPRDLKRHADGRLIEVRLTPHPVLTVHFTVVTRVDDDRIAGLVGFFQHVEESADLFVEIADEAIVAGTASAHLRLREMDESEHASHASVDGMLVLEVAWWNFREVYAIGRIQVEKALRHDEREVRRDEGDVQDPALVPARRFPQVVDGASFSKVVDLDLFSPAWARRVETRPGFLRGRCALRPVDNVVRPLGMQVSGELGSESVEPVRPRRSVVYRRGPRHIPRRAGGGPR